MNNNESSMRQRILSASVGGMITSLIMTPLDVVKIRMQANHKPSVNSKCFIYCNGLMDHLCACANGDSKSFFVTNNSIPWYKRKSNFNGTLDALSGIVRNEGVFSLWSGLSPTLLMALPQTVIYYSLNDWIKYRIKKQPYQWTSNTSLAPAFVGAVSRTIAIAAIAPLELLRTKMQSVKLAPDELIATVRVAIKQGGIRQLWLGMGPTLLRDVPYSALFWLVFDNAKSSLLLSNRIVASNAVTNDGGGINKMQVVLMDDQLPMHQSFAIGWLSGLVAGVLTHPCDVIKTHRQMELGEAIFSARPYAPSTWFSMRQLYRTNGMRALFSGFTPRLFKTTHASAIMITTFETLKHRLVADANSSIK